MENCDISPFDLQKRIEALEKRNKKLEKVYKEYKRVCRNEEERVKELNCLYQVAQCVVVETDLKRALEKIVRIIPNGWQYTDQACAGITVNDDVYLSAGFFNSDLFQKEDIVSEGQVVGKIEVFYRPELGSGQANPFLLEERNLLKGIANIISFYIKKQHDDEKRRIIQKQLLHADRLATIGQLAAGVAHELNEPLGNILGLAQLSLTLDGLPQQAQADLTKIQDCVLYSREIIKKLMEFSRQSSLSKKDFDLNRLIDDGTTFLEARCRKEGIKIVKQYGENIFVTADPTQIRQVIANLIINAIQAMKDGGRLTIITRKTQTKAIFSIEDNGVGIGKEDIGQAFMPFFTTKDVGEGTGLGLSVAYGIIQNHGGDIKVSSQIGKGTIFQVSLPLGGIE